MPSVGNGGQETTGKEVGTRYELRRLVDATPVGLRPPSVASTNRWIGINSTTTLRVVIFVN